MAVTRSAALPGQPLDGPEKGQDVQKGAAAKTSRLPEPAVVRSAGRPRPSLTLDLSAIRPSPTSPGGGEAASNLCSPEAATGFPAEYELGAVIGSGSVAVVKRARRRADGCEVAVKCIKTDDEEIQQFARDEYELLRSVQHPAIIRVEAQHIVGCRVWTVMELCKGGSLQAFVHRAGPLGEAQAVAPFRQLLEAVSYLHQRRIVHRDLKPENCLIGDVDCPSGPWLKVTDFNSAKVIGGGVRSSAMLTSRGTHTFSAPELLLGRYWNERVDIWASGLCLYFMLRGRIPFDCTHRPAREALAAGRLPQVPWHGQSADAQQLVHQCLAMDFRDRPPAMKLLLHPFFLLPAGKEEARVAGWLRSLVSAYTQELNLMCCTMRAAAAVAAAGRPALCPSTGSSDCLTERYSRVCGACPVSAVERVSSAPDEFAGMLCRWGLAVGFRRARSASAPAILQDAFLFPALVM